MKSKGEIILNVLTVISLCIFLWLFVSYIDIVSHNLTTQNYSNYNLFEIVAKHLG